MTGRINRCSHCGCDEPIHNAIDGKLYCNNCGMSLENSSVTNRNRVSKYRVDDDWIDCEIVYLKKRMKFDDSDAALTTETSVPILFALLEETKECRAMIRKNLL